MKSAFAPVAAVLLLASNAMAQLMVNTPLSAVVCQPLLITWSGGTPPYFLSILPGNQPSAAALLSFPQQTSTSLTWNVNITANTQLGLDLKDNTGTLAQSGVFTTQPSSDTSCLTGGTSSTGTGSTTGTTTSSSTTGSTPVAPGTTSSTPNAPVTTPTTPAGTPTTSSAAGSTTKAATTSAPATTSASSAAGNVANAAFAGAFGIGAALFGFVL